MDRNDILAYLLLVFLVLIALSPLLYLIIYDFLHPECHSSNLELLNKIMKYGEENHICACDMFTCVYVCEEMKKEYNFTDDCEDICIPSWCFGTIIRRRGKVMAPVVSSPTITPDTHLASPD